MHILELPSFFPPHGGLFCLEQAKALRDRGHEVRIIACTGLGASADGTFYLNAKRGLWRTEMDGIEVYGYYHHDIPKMVRLNTMYWLHRVHGLYRRYVLEHGTPDVIHAHCCKLAGIAAMQLSERYGVPYFITEHLSSELYVKDFGEGWTHHPWLRTMIVDAYQKAECVIPVAKELVDDVAPFFGRDYRWREVSNIIDTHFFAYKDRAPRGGRPFRYCCLAVANIHLKGYDVLAEVWRDMKDAELHIAGSGTDDEPMRHLFADSHGVTLHGHLDRQQVRDLLYQCDALVLPSRSEAQPLVILEAMATGIPVVSTECVPESERIPGACLIAKTGDADSLRQLMYQVRTIAPSTSFSDAVSRLASPETVARKIESIFCAK